MADNKKVLIITYYWPPSGGVGVQRWLKQAKYLPEYGWDPVILTPENPAFDLQDASLAKEVRPEAEVLKISIWEPYSLVSKLTGKKDQANLNRGMALEGEKKGLLQKLLPWLRGNLFIPDPRVFWVRPATDFALRIIENNNIKAIITTGPPHSMHLIGRRLKKKTGLPWLADFRDPWSKWEVLHRMQLSKPAMMLHKSLEKKVLGEADVVFAATPGLQDDLKQLGAKSAVTILNGVDNADFPDNYPSQRNPDKFRIVYVGLMNEKRNPPALWEAIEELLQEETDLANDLVVSLTGSISPAIQRELQSYESLRQTCQIQSNIAHSAVFGLYDSAAVLLLLVEKEEASKVVIPAKLYEYLSAQKPILYIGDPGNGAGDIIRKENAGKCFAHNEKAGIKEYLRNLYQQYKEGSSLSIPINYSTYLRKNQTSLVANTLDQLTQEQSSE